jgi:hypothetical protein
MGIYLQLKCAISKNLKRNTLQHQLATTIFYE